MRAPLRARRVLAQLLQHGVALVVQVLLQHFAHRGAVARASASIIFSCSFTARFHFAPSWLERKRSACKRALTWL